MDIITLTLAVKKALEELGVKNEKTQGALTWDGSYDDVVQVMGALPMGKISDNHVDLNSVDSVVVKYENGNTKTLTAANWIIQEEMGMQIMLSAEDEVPYVISSPADVEGMLNKGLYFTYSIEFYVEKITYATETIHPIDPKFIPGAVLPVVELTTPPTEEGAPLTEAECAILDEVYATGMPVVVRFVAAVSEVGTAQYGAVFTQTNIFGSKALAFDGGGIIFQLLDINENTPWTFKMVEG